MRWIERNARKFFIALMGGTAILLGLIILPLPLPFGIILIPIGFFILAIEFAWARRVLDRVQARTGRVGRAMKSMEDRAMGFVDRRFRTRLRQQVEIDARRGSDDRVA